MTSHRMTASTRDRSFASQLFRITFIFQGEEFGESVIETLRIEASFDCAAMTNGNDARFLGDHDHDGVALLAEPERGAVAQARAPGRGRPAG